MQVDKREQLEFLFGIVPDELFLKKKAPRPEHDQFLLSQYVRDLGATKTTAQMVNLWARAMHGVELSEESAAYFIDYCRSNHGLLAVRADDQIGGNYLRLQNGTTEIAGGIAALVGSERLFPSTPVTSIEDQKTTGRVVVRSKNGAEFIARKCIVSIPSTMYRELSFTPSLPPRLREIINTTRLSHYNKAIVFYRRSWWRDLSYNSFAFSYIRPVCIVHDLCIPKRDLYAFT
ncbi:hypothetical protein BDW74DRAFT_183845 [Aspergillus multicolor]|uniref:uncharacterized protein n=1 Tax=Aspergillus multicolor TaxID=41759 RepID=UPI003CCD801C